MQHKFDTWLLKLEKAFRRKIKQYGSSLAPTKYVRVSNLSVSLHHIINLNRQIWNCRQCAFQVPIDYIHDSIDILLEHATRQDRRQVSSETAGVFRLYRWMYRICSVFCYVYVLRCVEHSPLSCLFTYVQLLCFAPKHCFHIITDSVSVVIAAVILFLFTFLHFRGPAV